MAGCPSPGLTRGPQAANSRLHALSPCPEAGAWLQAEGWELIRATPCQSLSAQEVTEGQEAADPSSPAHPPEEPAAAREITTGSTRPSVAGPPPLRPDHQQPQTTGKRDLGSQLSCSSPSGIEKPPSGCPQMREVPVHSSMQTGPPYPAWLLPAPRKPLCERHVSLGQPWPKRNGPRTLDLIGRGHQVFLPGHVGCVLSRSSHAHPNDGEFCGF